MNDTEILDDELSKPEANDFWEAIRWWEKKRLIYIGQLVLTVIVVTLTMDRATMDNYALLFFITFFLLIMGNVFYVLGWAFELLIRYYFDNYKFPNSLRMIFFVIGSLFSVYIFWLSTHDILQNGYN